MAWVSVHCPGLATAIIMTLDTASTAQCHAPRSCHQRDRDRQAPYTGWPFRCGCQRCACSVLQAGDQIAKVGLPLASKQTCSCLRPSFSNQMRPHSSVPCAAASPSARLCLTVAASKAMPSGRTALSHTAQPQPVSIQFSAMPQDSAHSLWLDGECTVHPTLHRHMQLCTPCNPSWAGMPCSATHMAG